MKNQSLHDSYFIASVAKSQKKLNNYCIKIIEKKSSGFSFH